MPSASALISPVGKATPMPSTKCPATQSGFDWTATGTGTDTDSVDWKVTTSIDWTSDSGSGKDVHEEIFQAAPLETHVAKSPAPFCGPWKSCSATTAMQWYDKSTSTWTPGLALAQQQAASNVALCLPPLPSTCLPAPDAPNFVKDTLTCVLGPAGPAIPQVFAEPSIGLIPGHPAGTYECTGTHHAVASGTVGGKFGGGLFLPWELSVSVTSELLVQYDFACDYSMWAQASGKLGVERDVHMTIRPGTAVDTPIPPACGYDGVILATCETAPQALLPDTLNGAGIAGPTWGLPTQITVCPPSGDTHWSETAYNDAWQEVPFLSATQTLDWGCANFGIHYIAI